MTGLLYINVFGSPWIHKLSPQVRTQGGGGQPDICPSILFWQKRKWHDTKRLKNQGGGELWLEKKSRNNPLLPPYARVFSAFSLRFTPPGESKPKYNNNNIPRENIQQQQYHPSSKPKYTTTTPHHVVEIEKTGIFIQQVIDSFKIAN